MDMHINFSVTYFGNDQYINGEKVLTARLFAQYHYPQTKLMKKNY